MKKIFKNYKTTILLLISMFVGLIIGLVFKEKCEVLKPFGNLFINLLSTIVVPLVFTTITLSIASISSKRVFKVLRNTIIVFVVMSLISVLFGIIGSYSYKFVSSENNITLSEETTNNEDTNYLEKTIDTLSVSDFSSLLSKDNLIALILASIIIGIALNKTKEKTSKIKELLENINELLMKILDIIMLYAPIGIAAFFAYQVGTIGSSIATDYLKVFLSYTITCIIFAIVVYSFIAIICKKNVFKFWKECLPIILTSISTCSSAACLPIGLEVADKLEISDEAKTVYPLGVSFHKDGSVIDSVFKIMFLVYLFGTNVSILSVALVAIIATLLITAVPVGGSTLCEMMILTLLGFPVSALPILTIIATITDAPATLLNALGDTSAALLVDKYSKN